MGLTINSRSLVFTPGGNTISIKLLCDGMHFTGTGLNPGEKIFIEEIGSSGFDKRLAQITFDAANVSREIPIGGAPKWIEGIKIDGTITGGTWTLVVRTR